MFLELEKLINPDPKSLNKFQKIKSEFLSDKRAYDAKLLNRAKKQAIVLALATVISLLFLLYVFNVKSESDQIFRDTSYQIEQLESKLKDCN